MPSYPGEPRYVIEVPDTLYRHILEACRRYADRLESEEGDGCRWADLTAAGWALDAVERSGPIAPQRQEAS